MITSKEFVGEPVLTWCDMWNNQGKEFKYSYSVSYEYTSYFSHRCTTIKILHNSGVNLIGNLYSQYEGVTTNPKHLLDIIEKEGCYEGMIESELRNFFGIGFHFDGKSLSDIECKYVLETILRKWYGHLLKEDNEQRKGILNKLLGKWKTRGINK